MAETQLILVCSDDNVLAKRVRYLLARDETEVEITNSANSLEQRLSDGGVALLIISDPLPGGDVSELLSKREANGGIPPTIVLGGDAGRLPSHVQVVADQNDTHTLYRLASEALQGGAALGAPSGTPAEELEKRFGASRTERTETPALEKGGDLKVDEELIEDVEPDLEELESGDEMSGNENESSKTAAGSEEDITVFDVARYHAGSNPPGQASRPPKRSTPPKRSSLSGPLQPKRLARALYLCSARNADGALLLSDPNEILTIYFEKGSPIHVESSLRGDMLGRNLVGRGVLTENKYSECAKLAIEKGLSIGQATVELGYFSKEALGHEMGEDSFEQIIKRFAESEGTFEFHQERRVRTKERPYRLDVGRILAGGLRRHTSDEGIDSVVGEIETSYFKLRSSIETLSTRYPLGERDKDFLAFSGRAYNVADASESAKLGKREARVLMALLMTCDEVDPFTPGVAEFEERINEERRKNTELQKRMSLPPGPADRSFESSKPPAVASSALPTPAAHEPEPEPEPIALAAPEPSSPPKRQPPPPTLIEKPPEIDMEDEPIGTDEPLDEPIARDEPSEEVKLRTGDISMSGAPSSAPPPSPMVLPTPEVEDAPPPPSPITLEELEGEPAGMPLESYIQQQQEAHAVISSPPPPASAPPAPVMPPPAATTAADMPSIPPMPEPSPGTPGRIPRPVVFSPPGPRAPDGGLQETPERTRSRQHFQKGVALLGQGAFDEAEEGFRDAVALCADEHVYLIGLARAIYYNPNYTANGKLPVLRTIVDRATGLAPDDQRVRTLSEWVSHAEGARA